MTGSRGPVRPDVDPPAVQPPAPFVDRRSDLRRIDDRTAREERALLARILDVLASGEDAETRLARVLRLVADTAGARRAAVVTDDDERRVAVSASHGEE